MLITFKSAASGNVMMFEKNAREALGVFGKDPDAPQGIVTVEQLPGAMAALKAAIAADRAMPPEQAKNDEHPDKPAAVGFCQRAVPLVELLERSLEDKVPVIWGV
jgi:uncharacterized protein DUF1840